MANLTGTSGTDIITGTDGTDVLVGHGGSDQLNGGDGDDVLRGDEDGSGDPIRIVAFGDSLTSFFELTPEQQFPVQLAQDLAADGVVSDVLNFGVGGEQTINGLQRVDTVVAAHPDITIVEFGTNDAIHDVPNDRTETNLDGILHELSDNGIGIVLAGAYPNFDNGSSVVGHLDPQDAANFEAIYPRLAARYDAVLYPHFTDGVVTNPSLTVGDGIHQNAAGAAYIAANILDQVETAIDRLAPGGNDLLFGGNGNDRIIGGAGHDYISGGAGDDNLFGGSGSDAIDGGPGNDVIDSGPNADGMTGGAGNDRFVMAPGWGSDTVYDFSQGADQLDLTAFGIRGIADFVNTARIIIDHTGVTVAFGTGDQVMLLGLDHLTESDFFKG